MRENFGLAFHALLKHEGGFVNHPKDPGGMTNLGVTKRAWEDYVGHPVDEAQMRAPTPGTTDDSTKIATTEFVRNIIPTGVIVMWSGSIASIPTGWLICDGTNGTPDLRNRFIVGAGSTYSVAGTGGSAAAIS